MLSAEEKMKLALSAATAAFECVASVTGDSNTVAAMVYTRMRKAMSPQEDVGAEKRKAMAELFKVDIGVIEKAEEDLIQEYGQFAPGATGRRVRPKAPTKELVAAMSVTSLKVSTPIAKAIQCQSEATQMATKAFLQDGNKGRARDRRATSQDCEAFFVANALDLKNGKQLGTAFNGEVIKRKRRRNGN